MRGFSGDTSCPLPVRSSGFRKIIPWLAYHLICNAAHSPCQCFCADRSAHANNCSFASRPILTDRTGGCDATFSQDAERTLADEPNARCTPSLLLIFKLKHGSICQKMSDNSGSGPFKKWPLKCAFWRSGVFLPQDVIVD